MALAGVRAPTGEEDKVPRDDKQPPAALLNLFMGGSTETVQVGDGEPSDQGGTTAQAGQGVDASLAGTEVR